MIITFSTNNKVFIRKENNTLERCLDCVDRPNTIPYIIHAMSKNNGKSALVTLSAFSEDSKELDIVEQETFDATNKDAIRKYINQLGKKVIYSHNCI